MMIDSHAHYTHLKFDNECKYLSYENNEYAILKGGRNDVFSKINAIGVGAFIEPGITLESNYTLLKLAENNPRKVFPAVGVHPTRVFKEKWKNRKQINTLAENDLVIAIGETGLDFHYKRKDQHRFWQYMWFVYQLNIAKEKQLPLILHIRAADKAAIRLLKHYRRNKLNGVVHFFNSGYDVAMEYIKLGFHLGIGGALLQTDKRAEVLKEAVAAIPIEYILVETDSPFMHPKCDVLKRKKLKKQVCNTSLILPLVISEIARL